MRRLFLSLVLLCNSGGAQPHGAITEAALLGTGPQSLAGVAVDAEGNVYVAGTTTAEDFPDGNLAIGPTGGRSDVFVVKLDPTLTEILFAVRLGGSGEDFVTAMMVDATGAAYIAGGSTSRDWRPTVGEVASVGSFLLKLDQSGRELEFLAPIGGSPNAIALDSSGRIWIGGQGAGIPITADAIRSEPVNDVCSYSGTGLGGLLGTNCNDGFLMRLSADAGRVEYGTLIGSNRDDAVNAITAAPDGGVFVGGVTGAEEFPPESTLMDGSGSGGFVLHFNGESSPRLVAAWKTGAVKGLAILPSGELAVFGVMPDFAFLQFVALPDYRQVRLERYREEFGASRLAWASDGSSYLWTPAPITGDHWRSNLPRGFVSRLASDGGVVWDSRLISGVEDPIPAVGPDGSLYLAQEGSSRFSGAAATANQIRHGEADRGPLVLRVAPASTDDPVLDRVDNAATLLDLRSHIAPGEIVTLRGRGLGPAEGVAGLATELANVRVLFDETPAPLLWVQDRQVNLIAPWGLERPCLPPQPLSGCGDSEPIRMVLEVDGRRSGFWDIPYVPASPGVFTESSSGQGQVVMLNEDGSWNSAENPASAGELVTFYATGLGPIQPPGVDGQVQGHERVLVSAILPVEVAISRKSAEVRFAGVRPGMLHGLFEVQAVVPSGLEPGDDHRVMVKVLTEESQDLATMAVE